MKAVLIDAGLGDYAAVIGAAIEHFRLRPPARIRLVSLAEARRDRYYGRCVIEKHGHEILLRAPGADPAWLWTLAHELAHLRIWNHGTRHTLLAARICDFLQRSLME